LGADFVFRVQEVLDRISVMPRIHPIVHQNVRRGVVKKFPYVVLYQVEDDRLVIVSVFHSSRDPAVWKAGVP
jgi:toxin ParE1/3/4